MLISLCILISVCLSSECTFKSCGYCYSDHNTDFEYKWCERCENKVYIPDIEDKRRGRCEGEIPYENCLSTHYNEEFDRVDCFECKDEFELSSRGKACFKIKDKAISDNTEVENKPKFQFCRSAFVSSDDVILGCKSCIDRYKFNAPAKEGAGKVDCVPMDKEDQETEIPNCKFVRLKAIPDAEEPRVYLCDYCVQGFIADKSGKCIPYLDKTRSDPLYGCRMSNYEGKICERCDNLKGFFAIGIGLGFVNKEVDDTNLQTGKIEKVVKEVATITQVCSNESEQSSVILDIRNFIVLAVILFCIY